MSGDYVDDRPILDQEQMDRLKEWGGPELQQKMVELFLSHAGERMDQVREGFSKGDAREAENGAHTLKSSAGNVGAQRVQHLAQEAEFLAEAGDLDGLGEMLPLLEEEFRLACRALDALRQE